MNKLPKIELKQKPTYLKLAEGVDFYEIFKKIDAEFQTCFLFESLGEDGKFARYSIIGFDPEKIIRANGESIYINNKRYETNNPYFALREIMPEKTIARNYCGGLIGYLSYEAANYFEKGLEIKKHPDFDQFLFGVYTDGVILDKLTNEIFYFYYQKNRIQFLKKVINSTFRENSLKVKFLGDSLTKSEHSKIVESVKDEIKVGNIFQCEVGFKSEYKIRGNALKIYEKLRQVNPSPFMYYLKFADQKIIDVDYNSHDIRIIGASPELLFGLRDGEMQTSPLAGTIKRGKNKRENEKLAKILLSDIKERAEHNMLVDLHRNDLGRVAKFGTVRVTDFMSIKKFKFVQHISSEIVGIIKNNEDMFSALAANFPAGTLTGAPKIESMKIIQRNEKDPRGPYGGAVGQFGFNGDCTFAINIRSLFISKEYAFTQTSGGIVYDSKSDKEYEEIQRKLQAMKEVLK